LPGPRARRRHSWVEDNPKTGNAWLASSRAAGLVPGLGEPSGVEGVAVRPLERGIDRRIYTVVRQGTAARPIAERVRRRVPCGTATMEPLARRGIALAQARAARN
jgi:hypothetical protein